MTNKMFAIKTIQVTFPAGSTYFESNIKNTFTPILRKLSEEHCKNISKGSQEYFKTHDGNGKGVKRGKFI